MINIISTIDLGLTEQPIRISHAFNKSNYFPLHKHDGFCEIYVLLEGAFRHHINGSTTMIKAPSIVFIRETDTHRIENLENQSCNFYLVTIHHSLYYNLRSFLNIPEVFTQLDTYRESPIFPISTYDYETVLKLFTDITTTIPHAHLYQTLSFSSFILDLFSLFLPNINPSEQAIHRIPSWFTSLCEQAENKSVFVMGVPALTKISGKSNQYLCKCFHKYLHKTPSSFINDIRLTYAKNLLKTTDMSILDISMESGFENLSHFYHLFKNKFHVTPSECRKTNTAMYL